MKFCIVQAKALNCIFVRSIGKFNPEHMKSLIASVSSLDFYQTEVLLFHDMRLVDFDVDAAKILDVARSNPPQPLHSKLALIATDQLGYGMLRMLAAVRENIPRKVAVFRSVEEGLDWLNLHKLLGVLPDEVEAALSTVKSQALGDESEDFNLVITKVSSA